MSIPAIRREGQKRLRLKIAADVTAWTVAALVAFPLRVPNRWMDLTSLIVLYAIAGIPIKLAIVLGFGLQRQVWRRVTTEDLERIVAAVVVGTALLFSIGLVWYTQALGFPRTIPLIEGVLGLLGLAGIRVITRLRAEGRWRHNGTSEGATPRQVLLVGAGSAGTRIGREIRRRPETSMELVGFLDDDPATMGLTIASTRILGGVEDLPLVVRERQIDEILITMPAAGGEATRRVVELAREAGVMYRILPGINQVLSGDAQLAGVREVQVEDLLRRTPVELDLPSSYVAGNNVLVTGAGGSIGSELVRQLAHLGPSQVVLLDHDENALFETGSELRASVPDLHFGAVVGDIRDRAKVEHVMGVHQPVVVFHAAAHKHVSLMEDDRDEAVLNNVGGTLNLAEAALAAGVKRFVNISTDKAVRPASMMGVTKSVAERVVRMVGTRALADQVFVSVRFGNVLGSRGSVVPVFQEQIARGGPLTITDPEMTRYFMTIPEASRLVIQAGALGANGAVFVLDMGEPVRIVDLAREMIHLAGADEDDISIVVTGARPGEKVHEELFTDDEQLDATTHRQIMVAHHEPAVDEQARGWVDTLITAAERRDWREIDRCLKILLPDFGPTPEPDVVSGSSPSAA